MIIAGVLVMAALYFGRHILIPLALGLVLSFLLTPVVSLLEKIRLGRAPSVLMVLLLSLTLVGALSWGVAVQLVEIAANFSDYKSNVDVKMQSLHVSKDGNLSKAGNTFKELNRQLDTVSGQISPAQTSDKTSRPVHPIPVQVAPPPNNIFQDIRNLLGPLAGVVEMAVIVIIFTAFMLLKREDLRNRVIRLGGRGQFTRMTQALDDAARRLSRYLFMQFAVNAGYGIVFGGALYLIKVPHALLWGVLAAVLRFIPYVGTAAAAVLPIMMAIAVFPGWRPAGMAFAVFVALELVVSNFVEPVLYGAHTGISSLAILVAAVFWTTLWGPVGLILSTPLTVCLIVLGRYVPQLKFLEVVLGDEPVLTPAQRFYQRLLATDLEEARAIADAYLKDHSLESAYETIFIPALGLAEQDYQTDALDDGARRFMFRSTRALIDDLGNQAEEEALVAETSAEPKSRPLAKAEISIACIPARNGPDELVSMMVAQLLQQAGYQARQLRARTVEEAAAAVLQQQYTVVCVSSLAPFAIAQARALCRRLHLGNPGLKVVVGLWDIEGGREKAKERMGPSCVGTVCTKLSDALTEIRRWPESHVAGENAEAPGNSLDHLQAKA